MTLQQIIYYLCGIWHDITYAGSDMEMSLPLNRDLDTAIPKPLCPYVNQYGDNAQEFERRYDELNGRT